MKHPTEKSALQADVARLAKENGRHVGSQMRLQVRLESQEFFDLMQQYRFTPVYDQEAVTAAFEAVKAFVVGSFSESEVQAAVQPGGGTMKFKLLDGHDNDVLGGEVDVDNPFITQYGALVDGPAPRKLEVGQSCQQRYSMSGQKPTVYRVLRVS